MPSTVDYHADGPIAVLTLNRPEALNTIVPALLNDLEAAVGKATRDRHIKVILLQGAGRSFCGGFNFSDGFHQWDELISTDGAYDAGGDLIAATSPQLGWVSPLTATWRSPKPVVVQVHGWCVGGGSDLALNGDIIIASDDARIGTPYSRMWGCHLTGIWVYRLGLTRAKELALTGRPLSGTEAAEIGLINQAVPFAELQATARAMADRLAKLPASQLAAMKLIVNQAYENMGLRSTQLLGSVMDTIMRNTPEARAWIEKAERDGVGAALEQRDGPFADYSLGNRADKPDPRNVVELPAAKTAH